MLTIKSIKRIVRRNANLSVPWYLMACWAYYKDDDPIMDDGAFEYLARFIRRNWWTIKHAHKWLIDKDNLLTGYDLEYPSIVQYAVKDVR